MFDIVDEFEEEDMLHLKVQETAHPTTTNKLIEDASASSDSPPNDSADLIDEQLGTASDDVAEVLALANAMDPRDVQPRTRPLISTTRSRRKRLRSSPK